MEDQVRDFIPHLKVGATYLFEHVRKGPFVGVFKGTSPTHEGDPQDEIWLEIDVLTEDGSGQERLANSFVRDDLGRKMHPVYSAKRIRPSLLKSITTPSTDVQHQMAQHFADAKRQAEERAVKAGIDPIYPSLSMPTEAALKKLGDRPTEKKKGFLSRLFGGD